jgi:hypothetical protein
MTRAAIGLLLLSQLGCVLYDRQIVLIDPAASAAENRRGCAPGGRVVTVSFADGRAERGPLGALRNGFGITMSHVLTRDDLGAWVTHAVSDALRRSGDCVIVEAAPSWSPPRSDWSLDVAGAITDAWCDAYLTYWADVVLDVTVTDRSGRYQHKTYRGHGSGGLNVAASGAGYAEALQQALANAVSQLARDLNAF